jgi:hypothetical protein
MGCGVGDPPNAKTIAKKKKEKKEKCIQDPKNDAKRAKV